MPHTDEEGNRMDTWVWVVLALLALVAIAIVVWAAGRARRSKQLKEGFGPEYERVVDEAGDKREAERELQARRERYEEFDIRPLAAGARTRYSEEWRAVQERFVDEPDTAVRDADRLVQQVMAERGYPVEDDFERRADDLSVDYPELVENFRKGNRLWSDYEAGNGGTEDLRQAMVHYRSLFEELLEEEPAREETRR
jgi:hypothetical protein